MKEKGKDIYQYKNYQISSTGIIKTKERKNSYMEVNQYGDQELVETTQKPQVKKLIFDRSGYKIVRLCRHGECKKMKVHMVVARHFIKNPQHKSYVIHKNFDLLDNRAENLQGANRKEMRAHKRIRSEKRDERDLEIYPRVGR